MIAFLLASILTFALVNDNEPTCGVHEIYMGGKGEVDIPVYIIGSMMNDNLGRNGENALSQTTHYGALYNIHVCSTC